ncbi:MULTISPECIES: FTR1 family iron permease [Paraburkholderia]|uniref:High-affinity iron transporter n=1 Tax=Paraburkholderia tropica TaxID=92647 RepID=A0A1A5X9Y9_9BURK|nr:MULTISPECIES: FTR1 family protein [Paraburkholderia]MBB2979533.1 high-affinity iron transporter [Paraburkholderia tropica]MBB2999973.1 high-affinity iron transporter [Paraburkholderia tropica]MBB6319603.1 high-affinity iron transporter [Paraburkholderia tropica]MDE1142947.1 FTR1 family protein [Paraburkholderia tropica]OBR50262.1 FTR1 family iron permease [Paraburkholderia tropica]
MGQVLFIVWRESVEALLVVGILYAWLKNGDADARRGLPYLWAGVGLGILAAIALGAALVGFTEVLSGDAQDYFQTGMVLVACVLIVQMVLWMKQHGRTLKREMEESLEKSTRDANWWGITVLVALAIAREGSETVIFLYGLGFGQSGHVDASQYVAVLLGLGLAFLTFYILQLGGKYFSWRYFFRVTEIMLLFLGAGLFQTGVDKLIDKEILPTIVDQVWNSSAILDDSSTFGSLVATLTGYRAHPALMNLIAYAVYWLVVGFLARRASGRHAAMTKRTAA